MEHATHTHDEEQYIVHNPKEVMQILTNLVKQKAMLKVSFNQGVDEYLTTVIAIDTINHAVNLDIGRDDDFNRRLLASQHVIFVKDEGVRIKWTSTRITEVTLKDGKAIRIALPKDLIRLQRREFFRFATPIVNPVPCVIPKANEANPEEEGMLDFTLLDVSLGGVGVLAAGELDAALVIGATFNHCKISFPDVGMTNVTLQVKNITPFPVKDGVFKHRVGFQYITPSRGNEGLVNRYVFILERQAIALVNGAG